MEDHCRTPTPKRLHQPVTKPLGPAPVAQMAVVLVCRPPEVWGGGCTSLAAWGPHPTTLDPAPHAPSHGTTGSVALSPAGLHYPGPGGPSLKGGGGGCFTPQLIIHQTSAL